VKTDIYMWGPIFTYPEAESSRLEEVFPVDTTELKNVEGIRTWYLTHYNVVRSGDFLYAPFHVVAGARGDGDDPATMKTETIMTEGTGEATLYTYGIYTPSNLLSSLPRYPLHNITNFIIRDSTSLGQANRFTTNDWMVIFREMTRLERLRILAWKSEGTTRAVLTALIPISSPGGGSSNGNINDTDMNTDTNNTNMKLLCPQLRSITIEHESDLPAILLAKVIESRKKLGAGIEMVKVLVYVPGLSEGRRARSRKEGRKAGTRTGSGVMTRTNTSIWNGDEEEEELDVDDDVEREIISETESGVSDLNDGDGLGNFDSGHRMGYENVGMGIDVGDSVGAIPSVVQSNQVHAYDHPQVHELSTVAEEDEGNVEVGGNDDDLDDGSSTSSAYHSVSGASNSSLKSFTANGHQQEQQDEEPQPTTEPPESPVQKLIVEMDSSSSLKEYRLRSYEHLELLKKYVDDVEFVFGGSDSLSWDLVPPKWPTEVLKRTREVWGYGNGEIV
jgi:hypothetical protein